MSTTLPWPIRTLLDIDCEGPTPREAWESIIGGKDSAVVFKACKGVITEFDHKTGLDWLNKTWNAINSKADGDGGKKLVQKVEGACTNYNRNGDAINCGLLENDVRRHVCCAALAALFKQLPLSGKEGVKRLLEFAQIWTERAIGDSLGRKDVASNWDRGGVDTPVQLLDQWFETPDNATDGAGRFAPVWDLSRMFLGTDLDRTPLWQLHTPILVYDGRGGVLKLDVELMGIEGSMIYPHPREMSFVPMHQSFCAATQQAWEIAVSLADLEVPPGVVRFRIKGHQGRPLLGGSHGVAMTVALVQLLRKQPLAPGTAITIRLPDANSDKLRKVGHVFQKVVGVYRENEDLQDEHPDLELITGTNISKVIIHAEDVPSAEAAVNACDASIELETAETLDEACREASGLVEGLADYFKKLSKRPDDPSRRPIYLPHGVLPSELYVKPDVLVCEVRPDRDGPAGMPGAMGSPGSNSRFDRSPIKRTEQPLPDIHGIEVRKPFDQVEAEQQRLVLLGPQGGGKTSLAERIASKRASEARELLADQDFDIENPPLPIALKLDDLAREIKDAPGGRDKDQVVREAIKKTLVSQFQESRTAPFNAEVAAFMAEKAHQRTSYLLLDGLDEVKLENEPGLGPLWDVLADVKTWQCRVLIASRPYGYRKGQFPFGIVGYQLAPFDEGQIDQFLDHWFAGDEERQRSRTQLNELRRKNTAVAKLCQTPFFLTLLCSVQQNGAIPEGVTRTSLYKPVILQMLGLPVDAERGGGKRPPNPKHANRLEKALMDVVWHEFRDRVESSRIDSVDLDECLVASDHLFDPLGPSRGVPKADLSEAIIGELSKRRMLCPEGADEFRYAFSHRSLMEYLLAKAIAQQINGKWKPTLAAGEEAWSPQQLLEFLNKCADSSHWDLVIQFTAGLLNRPAPLLELLADEQRDGFFRFRLGLAGKSLGEIPSEQRERLDRSLIDNITQQIWDIWWMRKRNGAIQAFRHLDDALPPLVRAGGKADGKTLLDFCSEALADDEPAIHRLSADALSILGEAAARKDVVDRLVKLLRHDFFWVRESIARALGRLGPTAVRSDVLDGLMILLNDPDVAVVEAAVDALARFGPSAASAGVRVGLVEWLTQDHMCQNEAATRALERFGPPAVPLDVSNQLLEDLDHVDFGVKRLALAALGHSVPTRTREDVVAQQLDCWVEMLDIKDSSTRSYAVMNLSFLGPSAAREDVLDRLLIMLNDKNEDATLRCQVACALCRLGPFAARDRVVDSLVNMLEDEAYRWDWRFIAPDMALLGPSAARNVVLDRLVEMLNSSHAGFGFRTRAIDALGRFGPSAAREDVVKGLLESVNILDLDLASMALRALGDLGPSTATEDVMVVDFLVDCLNRGSDRAEWAAYALVRTGAAEACEDVLDRLLEVLDDPGPDSSWAANALSKLPLHVLRRVKRQGSE